MVPRTGEIDELDLNDDLEETVDIPGVAAHRADIEQTRADISDTLDAIKEKLQPQTLIQQAKETAQEVTAGVAEKAREVVEQARESAHDVVQQARETVHTVVQEAREAIPEAAHNAMSSAVDTAKGAVGGVMDSAKEAVSGVVDSAKDAGSTVVETVRTNPLPYALVGLGLGLLYMNSRNPGPRTRRMHERRAFADSHPDHNYNATAGIDLYRPAYETGTSPRAAWGNDLGALRPGDTHAERSVVGDTMRQARDKIGDVVETVQNKAGQVMELAHDKAGQAVDQVQETVSEIGTRTTNQAREMAQGFHRTLEQNPLLVGAIALGIGAAIGFMMPETQPENRLMGETRDRLVDNVQQKAHEVADKVQTVASETLDTAKEKVQNVAAEVMDTAKEKVQTAAAEVMDTAQNEAEKQGVTA